MFAEFSGTGTEFSGLRGNEGPGAQRQRKKVAEKK